MLASKADQTLNAVLDLVKLTAGHTERLDGINDRLDMLNGSVKRHDEELKKLQCNYVQFREKCDNRAVLTEVNTNAREVATEAATNAREKANLAWRTWLKYPLTGAGAVAGIKLIENLPAAYAAIARALLHTT